MALGASAESAFTEITRFSSFVLLGSPSQAEPHMRAPASRKHACLKSLAFPRIGWFCRSAGATRAEARAMLDAHGICFVLFFARDDARPSWVRSVSLASFGYVRFAEWPIGVQILL